MINTHVKKTLVFKTSLAGHRLEYVHHIYEEACKRTDEEFVFVLPDSFSSLNLNFTWKECSHVRIVLMSADDIHPVLNAKERLGRAKKSADLLRKYVMIEQPSHVLLIMLMSYMPFLALMRWHGVKISGIIYSIYLYETSGFVRHMLNRFFYTLFAKRKCFDKLFILNDEQSTKKLNSIYKTEKFTYLPDPIPIINRVEVRNIRVDMGINTNDRFFLHFGGLMERKGTLQILGAIGIMKDDDLRDKVFVFAGVVGDDIKERFYSAIDKIKERARIIVFDKFCSYSLIYNLCESCEVILIPYSNTSQSSGVLGYASYFNKPVIGPSEGLIGSLIKEFKMGLPLNTINSEILRTAICGELPVHSNDYYKTHTVNDFLSTLLS